MKAHQLDIPTLSLERGGNLNDVVLHYRIKGDLFKEPVVWVFHALTANDDPTDWWPGLFGPKGLYGEGYAVVCANVLGSPYGSSSPGNHALGGQDFPILTVRDTVSAQLLLAQHLGLNHIHTLIGGSFGGYQALEFALGFEGSVDHMILLATGAEEMPWNKAIHEAQRLAMEADATLWTGDGSKGLQAARGIGMLNYRTTAQFNTAQQDSLEELDQYRAPSYIRYQGEKLVRRFDAPSYYRLTQQLDTHHIGRGRGGTQRALASLQINTLVLGFDSDVLIPITVQQSLIDALPTGRLKVLQSAFGHDGFLLEYEQITKEILEFYHA